MSQIGVYVITELKTGCFYIGSTGNIIKRLNKHWRDLINGAHHNSRFQSLWNNGAREFNVSFSTIASRDGAYKLEEKMIKFFKDSNLLLNIGLSSVGGDNLTKNPNRVEIIDRIANSVRARIKSSSPDELKIKFGRNGERNGMFGRTHTPETLAKLRLINIGNQYCLGKKLSDERRLKISNFAKTRTGEKNPFYGRKHSAETLAKISAVNRNKLPPNTRKVSVDGELYESATAASRALGTVTATILHRIKSKNPKYKDYHYIT